MSQETSHWSRVLRGVRGFNPSSNRFLIRFRNKRDSDSEINYFEKQNLMRNLVKKFSEFERPEVAKIVAADKNQLLILFESNPNRIQIHRIIKQVIYSNTALQVAKDFDFEIQSDSEKQTLINP